MKKSKSYRPVSIQAGRLLTARVLLVASFGIAGYLAWGSISGGTLPGCGTDSDCDKVLQSRWAYWVGIPVSVPALAVYAGLLGTTFAMPAWAGAARKWAPVLGTGLSLAVMGGAAWFIGLQLFVIHAFCRFCLAAHGAALVAAVILFNHFVNQVRSATQAGPAIAQPLRAAFGRGMILGITALMMLVAGQHVRSPRSFVENALADGASGPNPATRVFPLHNGKFELRLNELPLIGPVTAPHVMVSLFDYTCHYCRDLHELLVEAQQHSQDQLAVVSLPMPLDSTCNHLIQRTQVAHVNACEYAKLGLAVSRAKPEVFRQFDGFLFGPPSAPPIGEARRQAEALVGKENLEKALADRWVADRIQADIDIFQANNQVAGGGGRMPQLMLGRKVVSGPISRREDLHRLIEEQFGLKTSLENAPLR